jgi:hypothetical protein
MPVPLILSLFVSCNGFIPGPVPAGIYGNNIVPYSNYVITLITFLAFMPSRLTETIISIAAKIHYGTSLSNVALLHGTAESLLILTNLFIVLGSVEEAGQGHG